MSDNSLSIISDSTNRTKEIGAQLGSRLKGGEAIELISDLGSGKTTFVKGLADGSGSRELVSSPSFTICNEYACPKFKIYHFDFYRLNDPGIIKRELAEVVDEPSNVIVIEWPTVIENILPLSRLVITISVTKDDKRLIKIDYPKELNYLVEGLS
ncbi:MAG: tRNA (adenosine(37)-N6)-threonylcarbamoyltransferase complex ATPase subunit type 1 TsaE [Candidatus Saccharibacteria bacterium]